MQAKNFFAWSILVLLAILLIVAGTQGSAGRILAVALCPSKLNVNEGLFLNPTLAPAQQSGTTPAFLPTSYM